MTGTTIIDHGLATHKLSLMRDIETSPNRFRRLVRQASWILCSEMTRDLELDKRPIETPNCSSATGRFREQGSLVIMPILRAGLVMAESFGELLPLARTAHVGIFRDAEKKDKRHCYMLSLPKMKDPAKYLLLDVTVSRGATMSMALSFLKDAGVPPDYIRCGCILAARPGIERLEADHPDVSLFALGLDEKVDKKGFIIPGLGNPSVRLFRTDEDDLTGEEGDFE